MLIRKAALIIVVALTSLAPEVYSAQNILLNGSMESGAGPISEDPHNPDGWIRFGPTVERSDEANLVPMGAGHALKAFSSDPQVGAYQDVPVTPGQQVRISGWLHTRSSDRLRGDAEAWIILEFYNSSNQLINIHPLAVLNAASAADTWFEGIVGPFAAPANTAYARMTCVWTWNGSAQTGGSAFWDDCKLTINAGTNQLINGNFETAGVGENSPTGIDDWLGFNDQAKSEDVAQDGISSVKLGIGSAYSGLFQNMGVLEAGEHVRLVAYVLNPSGAPLASNSRAGIKLEFDPVGIVPPPEELLAFNQDSPSDTWQLHQLNTTVPADITVARLVCIYGGNAQTTGSVHFDATFAARGGSPGVNRLLNPSFESGDGGFNGLDFWFEFNTPDVSQAQKSGQITAFQGDSTMRAAGAAFAGVYQEIVVSPGETLSFRAQLNTPSFDDLTGTGVAGLKVEWSPGSVPGDVDIGPGSNTITAAAPRNVWIPLSIDYTMPSGSSAISRFVNLIERGTAATGSVYFDSCEAVVLNRFDGADADGDDDEDLRDFADLQLCFEGPGGTPLQFGCLVFDSDFNGLIDLADYNYFRPRLTGPQ